MSVTNKIRAMLNIAEKKPSDLADCLGISVQAVRNKFSRDSFSVSDIIKITDTLGWELQCKSPNGQSVVLTIDDIKKPTTNSEDMGAKSISTAEQPIATPNTKQKKNYKPFTDADAQRLDLSELLTNIRYQMDIADTFGTDVLATLLEKARQQPTSSSP